MSKINQRNKDGQPHGLWEHYYSNGQLGCKGTYANWKRYGLWEFYHRDGTIEKQAFYSKALYKYPPHNHMFFLM